MTGAITVRATALALAVAAALAFTGAAGANGVISGKTKLKPDPDTFEALADMSIAVETTGRAEFMPSGARFPVQGGDVAPQAGYKGLVVHTGGLRFSREGASVKFSRLAFIIRNNKIRVFARANGLEQSLMTLTGGQIAGTDTSFVAKDWEAKLSRRGAETLTETFDFPFQRGIPLGTTTTKATITEEQVQE